MSHPVEAAVDPSASQVDYVRSRPELYFRGPVDLSWLVGLIVAGALAHGAHDVAAMEKDGWWAVTSSHDWLDKDAVDAFFTLAPDPAMGPNTHRMEILLTAFAQDVWTATPGDSVAISRVGQAPEVVRSWVQSHAPGRIVAFRFDEAPPGRHLAVVPYDDALSELRAKLDAFA